LKYRRLFHRAVVSFLIALLTKMACVNAADKTTSPDGQLLREAGVDANPASLLEWLHERSGNDADLLRVNELVRQLGNSEFRQRDQAAKNLVAVGPFALAALRYAKNDPDQEIVRRAKSCIEEIERHWNTGLRLAVVRHLVASGTAGAQEALFRFLPYAADEELEEEIWFGLDTLVKRQGKIAPVFKTLLGDNFPVRRAVAAYILGRRGNLGRTRGRAKAAGRPPRRGPAQDCPGAFGCQRQGRNPSADRAARSAGNRIILAS